MRRLQEPALDAESVYIRISKARSDALVRERLLDTSALVFSAYEEYKDAPNDVTVLRPANLAPAEGKDLQTNYTSGSKTMMATRATILQENLGGRCPLCGQGQATTLDHYLPRSIFPEFSVLPLNLVPACGRCNLLKGIAYTASNAALFLHAYLDDIWTDVQFLFAGIDVADGYIVAKFWVEPPLVVSRSLRGRIVSHFRELDLETYYLQEGVSEIAERRGSIRKQFELGGAHAVRAYLGQEAASIREARGMNHWLYALLTGMAECDEVCHGTFH